MTTTSAPQQPIEIIAPTEIPIDHKSGFVVYFTLADQHYTITAGCECPAEAFTLFDDARPCDHTGEHSVKLVCVKHGPRAGIAYAVRPRVKNPAIFGWCEERFRNDKRPQWGKTARGGIA